MAFLCQYILNINCLWKFLSKIVLFIAYLGFLLSRTVSIPIINSQTKFATLTPCFSQSHKYSVIGLFGIQAHPTTNSCRAYKIIINLNDIMYEPALT